MPFLDMTEQLEWNLRNLKGRELQEKTAPILRKMALEHLEKGKGPKATTAEFYRSGAAYLAISKTTVTTNYKEFIRVHRKKAVWGESQNLLLLAERLQFNFVIRVYNKKTGKRDEFSPVETYIPGAPTIYLCNDDNQHFYFEIVNKGKIDKYEFYTLGNGDCLYNALAQALQYELLYPNNNNSIKPAPVGKASTVELNQSPKLTASNPVQQPKSTVQASTSPAEKSVENTVQLAPKTAVKTPAPEPVLVNDKANEPALVSKPSAVELDQNQDNQLTSYAKVQEQLVPIRLFEVEKSMARKVELTPTPTPAPEPVLANDKTNAPAPAPVGKAPADELNQNYELTPTPSSKVEEVVESFPDGIESIANVLELAPKPVPKNNLAEDAEILEFIPVNKLTPAEAQAHQFTIPELQDALVISDQFLIEQSIAKTNKLTPKPEPRVSLTKEAHHNLDRQMALRLAKEELDKRNQINLEKQNQINNDSKFAFQLQNQEYGQGNKWCSFFNSSKPTPSKAAKPEPKSCAEEVSKSTLFTPKPGGISVA